MREAETIQCGSCGKAFSFCGDYPDLIVGERYQDTTSAEEILKEEETNRETTLNFWVPLFQKLFSGRATPVKLLSLGCGTGMDVEVLCQHGFDCFGVDCGNRTFAWARRAYRDRYFLANGKHLPFPQQTFDGIFCGCLFPHIGVQGVTYKVTNDFYSQRLELAKEMARVLKPDGKIVTCNPNRFFPFDIFHGHTAEKTRLRPSWPWDPLLLSRQDYEELFREFGYGRASGLPVENYWSFAHSRQSMKGRVLAAPVRFLFWLVSRKAFSFLRTSFLNPWIIVLIERSPNESAMSTVPAA